MIYHYKIQDVNYNLLSLSYAPAVNMMPVGGGENVCFIDCYTGYVG